MVRNTCLGSCTFTFVDTVTHWEGLYEPQQLHRISHRTWHHIILCREKDDVHTDLPDVWKHWWKWVYRTSEYVWYHHIVALLSSVLFGRVEKTFEPPYARTVHRVSMKDQNRTIRDPSNNGIDQIEFPSPCRNFFLYFPLQIMFSGQTESSN